MFAPGATSANVFVPLCGDIVADTNETFVATLTGLPAGTGTSGPATVTINDTANQFKNPTLITINQGTSALPYPSTITVAGAAANPFRIRVTLYDLWHERPDDIDVLLVGPNGAKYVLMSDTGGTIAVPQPAPQPSPVLAGTTLTLADYPNAVLPDAGPLVTGIFKPTSCETPVTNFPAPAPVGPYVEPGCTVARTNAQTLFGNFAGSNPNGVWSLYIRDDNGVARPFEPNAPEILRGEVQGGWGIELLPSTAAGVEISGRVLTPDGRGVRGAVVHMTDASGNVRTATTSSFGYYRFEDVEINTTQLVGVKSARFSYVPRLINVVDGLTDVNFTALE